MEGRIEEPHIAALASLAAAFRELGVRPVLIGGVAVSLVAEPRFTHDVDALVIFDTADVPRLMDALRRHELEPMFSDVEQLARMSRIAALKHTPTGTRVDIALGCMPFEAEVLERAYPSPDPEIQLLLPTPEDLVILKAIANRPQDREDIRRIARVYPSLDRARIRQWVNQYAELLEEPERWNEIEPLLRS